MVGGIYEEVNLKLVMNLFIQDPSCNTPSAMPTSPMHTTPSKSPSTRQTNKTLIPTNATTVTPTKVSPVIVKEINGSEGEYLITGLRHFVDYKISVSLNERLLMKLCKYTSNELK